MSAADIHLSVEVGPWWTTAVYLQAGRPHPVLFDGSPRCPSGLFHDPHTGTVVAGAAALTAGRQHPDAYRTDPLAAVHAGGDNHEPDTALAVLLAHVANTATAHAGSPVAALTVITGQPWGPRSRHRLTHAATTAGLPEPHIVTAAAAAAVLIPPPAAGTPAYLLVCTAGDAHPVLTVIDAGSNYTQLAATSVVDPDCPAIDQALAAVAAERASADTTKTDWQTLLEIHNARRALTHQPRASVLLPAPYPPVALDHADIATAAKPHLDRLRGALTTVLTDADLDRADVTATILVGADTTAADLHAALTDAGLPPAATADQPHSLAEGASRLTAAPTAAAATAATARIPRTRLTARHLAATALLAAGSVALLLQTVATADVNTLFGNVTGVRLPAPNLALAAALAATAAFTAAHLAPTTWLTPAGLADEASTGILLRRGYLAAAATGLALAGLWGLGVSVAVSFSPQQFLQSAMIGAAPVVVTAAIIAVVAPRIPAHRLPTWLGDLQPPVVAIVTGAAGVYLTWAAYTLTFPVNVTGYHRVVAMAGAALLGAATAATATRQRLLRFVVGTVLAIGYAVIVTVDTAAYLTTAFAAALAWWACTVAATTIHKATPGLAGAVRRVWDR